VVQPTRPGAAIRAMLLDGNSYSAIVRELGCSKAAVSYHAARLGRGQSPPAYDWSAVQEFYNEGHSRLECIEQFGFSPDTWSRAVRRGHLQQRAVDRLDLAPGAPIYETNSIGNTTEGMVLAGLLRAGYRPLLPFGSGHRYDLAFDDGGVLKRVQCKTGHLNHRGAVTFTTCNQDRSLRRRSYRGEADYFGVYCPENGAAYLVPVDDVGVRLAHLRVKPPKVGGPAIRWADSYLLG